MRGVNVGGRNKLPMRELAAVFTDMGCQDVQTYIQSGNVVYSANSNVAGRVAQSVMTEVRLRFGITSPVIVRSAMDMTTIVSALPFTGKKYNMASVYIGFLAAKPAARALAALDFDRSPGDSFQVRGKDVYMYLTNGAARTKLTNNYFDAALETVSTFRNWRTVTKLVELAGAAMA